MQSLAAGLLALGVVPEQRVGIASSTRYEWILADLAVMCAGVHVLNAPSPAATASLAIADLIVSRL